MIEIRFSVRGLAAPKGSHNARAVYRKGADGVRVPTGRVNVTDDNKRTAPWEELIHDRAEAAVERWCRENTSVNDSTELRHLFEGPVSVGLAFQFDRPKTHYGTGYNKDRVKPSAPIHPVAKSHLTGGDIDKLARTALDAMTGVIYKDDSQVVHLSVSKAYGSPAGLYVRVWPPPPIILGPLWGRGGESL